MNKYMVVLISICMTSCMTTDKSNSINDSSLFERADDEYFDEYYEASVLGTVSFSPVGIGAMYTQK